MSITNPQTDNKNKVIPVRRSIMLACGLSLMIGLSGCSDSGELTQADTGDTQDTSTETTDNQDNTNQETGDSPATEENVPSDETEGGGDQGDSESPDNGDNGDSGNSGSGDSSEDNTPTDTSKLHVKFTRSPPPANSAPHVQRQNQELSGRLFQLEVYTIDDELNLRDVTTDVTWNTISEECNGEPCYTLDSEGRLIAGAKGKFSVQAEHNGLLSPVVNLETPRKLETCGVEGNTDMDHQLKECLHIIAGNSGNIDGKWFTEPPRPQVMRYMYYTSDKTP